MLSLIIAQSPWVAVVRGSRIALFCPAFAQYRENLCPHGCWSCSADLHWTHLWLSLFFNSTIWKADYLVRTRLGRKIFKVKLEQLLERTIPYTLADEGQNMFRNRSYGQIDASFQPIPQLSVVGCHVKGKIFGKADICGPALVRFPECND